jgi:DHA1 family tetracycline resistance protein-like MFS transporter
VTSRYALAFIFVTMLVDTIGLGIIIPVAPVIIAKLTGQPLNDAAWWGGKLMFAFALMQVFCAPVIGNLSDRFGRRPVLILALAALGVDYLITAVAPTITWLFVGRILSGMAGASYSTANAYIADVSPPEKRAANFGLVGAAFGLGFIIGPFIGGMVGTYAGERAPFFLAAGLAFANAAFGYFVLRESLPKERRRKFELWRANPIGSLVALMRYPSVFGLIGVLILLRLAHDVYPTVWTYYTMLKFHWSMKEVSYSLAMVGITTALVFGFLTRILIPRIGETNAVYAGLACGSVALMGYAFSTQGWMMYPWMLVSSFLGLAMPALNSLATKKVPADEQGELQGALASLGSLTSVGTPLLFPGMFAFFSAAHATVYFPGAPFFASGVFLVIAALVFMRARAAAALQPAE